MMFKLKQAEKDKVIGEKMKGEKELEMYLNEIPQVTSLGEYRLHQNHHQNMFTSASVSPSSLSPFSAGFYSSEDGSSPSVIPYGYQTPSSNYFDSLVSNNSSGHMLDDFGLSENLSRMHIGDEHKDCSNFGGFGMDPDGFRFSNHLPRVISPYNVDHCCPNEGFNGDFRSPVGGYSRSSYDHNKATFLSFPQGDNVGTSMDPCCTQSHSPILYSDPSCQNGPMDYVVELRKEQARGYGPYGNGGIHLQNPSMSRPCGNDALYNSLKCGIDVNGERSVFNPLDSYQLMNPKLTLAVENPTYNCSTINQKPRAIPNCKANPVVLSRTNAGDIEGFNCEDSFIIPGKRVKFVADKQCDHSRGLKKNLLHGNSIESRQEKSRELRNQNHFEGICENVSRLKIYSTLSIQPTNSSMLGLQGIIYFMAKDQYGCRFLQKKFDEGTTQDVQLIFNEIIDHVVELMVNPFGNYLVQKLMEVCSEEQRMQIVLMVTEDPRVLVRICLNTHGTCVMQKLIETLKTRQQISLLIMALEPGFLDLVKDLNGNHVVQRCLQCFGKEHNKFIFNAATKYCVDIATHRHGCCVLNKCIAHSNGKHREKLVAEICANGLMLAQDSFGNYVVQYIIELKNPSAAATLLSKFEGHFVYLSMQKFSSHVVEKFLKCFEESIPKIISEFLSVSHFDRFLQDPFANYVVQSALEVSKGPLRTALIEAVQPHAILRTSPYCKKLFSRNLLKK